MKGAIVRSGMAYLVMVGLPAAGLVAVVRAGAALEAPPAIGGEWIVDAPSELAECTGLANGSTITIEQSGAFVRAHAGASHADGRMDGGRTRVALRAPGGSCADQEIAIELEPEGDALAWSASAPSCRGCDSLRFSTRRPPQE